MKAIVTVLSFYDCKYCGGSILFTRFLLPLPRSACNCSWPIEAGRDLQPGLNMSQNSGKSGEEFGQKHRTIQLSRQKLDEDERLKQKHIGRTFGCVARPHLPFLTTYFGQNMTATIKKLQPYAYMSLFLL
jgi:hypothetical protein